MIDAQTSSSLTPEGDEFVAEMQVRAPDQWHQLMFVERRAVAAANSNGLDKANRSSSTGGSVSGNMELAKRKMQP
jgi:hypothetical protein